MGLFENQATTEHPELYPNLTKSQVRTLGIMASNEIKLDGIIEISRSTLARQCGLSVQGLAKHLKALEAQGYIVKQQNRIDPARPQLYARNTYKLLLKAHPASCKSGRHIDPKQAPTLGNPVTYPQTTQLPTPGNTVTEGEQLSDPLNKENETVKKSNIWERASSCSGCEGFKPGYHASSCSSHPAHINGGLAWNITLEQYRGPIPWESLTKEEQQEHHRQRMTDYQRSKPPTKEQLLEHQLLKMNAGTLAPGNRSFCLTFPEHDLELASSRAVAFQNAGFEWDGIETNPWPKFCAGEYQGLKHLDVGELTRRA
jgi:hypothetical protein